MKPKKAKKAPSAQMRASHQERVGTSGASDVMGNLQRINWGPVENTRHDLGTDLFCQVRDERRFDLGLFVGIQVKSGASWFDDEIKDDAGNVTGWWYYESEPRHFEYWTSHTLPHFVVLNDEATRISYWAHVTPGHLINTGQGFKIAVPSDQTIDVANLPALIQVAATQRKGYELAGSSWRAGVSELGPGKRLRHALLAPRLVAPHRNARPQGTLEPEEAIAMITHGRFSDFDQLATADDMIPDATTAREHKNLRWRLLSCVWAVAEEAEDSVPLTRALLGDCPTGSADHAAVTALLLCQLAASEQWDEAITIAKSTLEGDDLSPADTAWISSHLASLLLEIGKIDDARDAALGVLRNMAGLEPDVTTLALQAATSWIVFSTADISARVTSRTDLLSSTDNPVAWWREQTASYGLNDAVLKDFRARLKDSTERWTVEDVAYARLWSAATTAQLAADYGVTRLHLRQMGRYLVSQGLELSDASLVSDGMMQLRRGGDVDALKLTIRHTWTHGPLSAQTRLADAITPPRWTHSLARIDLSIWQHAGDCISPGLAGQAIDACLDVLKDPEEFHLRVRPTFLVASAVIDALTGLVRAGDRRDRARILRHLSDLPDLGDGIDEQSYARLVARLVPFDGEIDAELANHLTEAGRRQSGKLLAAALLELSGTQSATEELLARAERGDAEAIDALGDVTRLSPATAQSAILRHAAQLEDRVRRARKSSWGFGGRDTGGALAVLNFNWPEKANWEPIFALLQEPLVSGEDKRGVAEFLLRYHADLPPMVKQWLRDHAESLVSQPQLQHAKFQQTIGGTLAALAIRSGGLADQQLAHTLAAAFAQPSQSRIDMSGSLGFALDAKDPLIFIPLLGDHDPKVRRQAAAGLIGLVLDDQPSSLIMAGLEVAIQGEGALVALTVAARLRQRVSAGASWPLALLRDCEQHSSAAVRLAARVGRTV